MFSSLQPKLVKVSFVSWSQTVPSLDTNHVDGRRVAAKIYLFRYFWLQLDFNGNSVFFNTAEWCEWKSSKLVRNISQVAHYYKPATIARQIICKSPSVRQLCEATLLVRSSDLKATQVDCGLWYWRMFCGIPWIPNRWPFCGFKEFVRVFLLWLLTKETKKKKLVAEF